MGEKMNVAARRLSANFVGLGSNFLGSSNSPAQYEKWPLTVGESGHFFLIGRGEKIRTSDPHTPSVVRYQAAPRPDRMQKHVTCLRVAMILAAVDFRKVIFSGAGS